MITLKHIHTCMWYTQKNEIENNPIYLLVATVHA